MPVWLTVVAQVVSAIVAAFVQGWRDRQTDISRDRAMTDLGAATSIIKGQADDAKRSQAARKDRDDVRRMSDDDLDKWL